MRASGRPPSRLLSACYVKGAPAGLCMQPTCSLATNFPAAFLAHTLDACTARTDMGLFWQVLVSWECTIAHAVPWPVFDPWIAKDTPVSRFMAAICASSIAYEHKVSCPPAWHASPRELWERRGSRAGPQWLSLNVRCFQTILSHALFS